nr:hypothetical protein [Pantoea agglomerans]
MDFYLGLERTFQDLNLSDGGRRIQSRNMHDDVRVGRAVYQAFRDRNKIAKIVNIIIDDSLQYLSETALRKVYDQPDGYATYIVFLPGIKGHQWCHAVIHFPRGTPWTDRWPDWRRHRSGRDFPGL